MAKVSKDEKNWMIIRVTDIDLKDAFLAKARKAGLSISNNQETKTGIEHIKVGDSMSLGTSDKFQVNWARSIDYYANRGIVPVYDISLDWSKIVKRLEGYIANQDKGVELESGDTYTISGNTVTFNDDNSLEFTSDEIATIKKVCSMGVDISYNEETEVLTIDSSDGAVSIQANELDNLNFD